MWGRLRALYVLRKGEICGARAIGTCVPLDLRLLTCYTVAATGLAGQWESLAESIGLMMLPCGIVLLALGRDRGHKRCPGYVKKTRAE